MKKQDHNSRAHDLLLLIFNLSQITLKEKIIDVFTGALGQLWPDRIFVYRPVKPDPAESSFEISASGSNYGYVCIEKSAEPDDEELALLYNATAMLAVIIKKNEQDALLANEKLHLQKLVDEKLLLIHESEERFRKSIDFSPIPTAIAKTNGELILLNKQFINSYGFTLEEIPTIGKWFELAYPDEEYRNFVINDWSKEVEHSIQNNVPVNVKNYSVRCKNDEVKTVAVSAYFEKDISIGLFQDITERKQAEQKIMESQARLSEALEASNRSRHALLSVLEDQRQSEREIQKLNAELEHRVAKRTQQLEAANKELSFHLSELEQFSYISNHDLREPLRTLTQFTQLFNEKYAGTLDEEGEKYIEFISKSASRMNLLVKDLFDYSMVGRESVKTLIDFNKIVDAVLSDLGDSIKESNAKISVQKLPTIHGYETEMRLLFQNLVTNAIKYHKKEIVPEIIISAESHEKEWLFSIKDNGIGIEKKNNEKIFIIFQRLHNRNEYEGTGIGLAHCKKVVEMHGGKIWVDSTPGEGSTFLFTIPT